jgi:hypothetical protein
MLPALFYSTVVENDTLPVVSFLSMRVVFHSLIGVFNGNSEGDEDKTTSPGRSYEKCGRLFNLNKLLSPGQTLRLSTIVIAIP